MLAVVDEQSRDTAALLELSEKIVAASDLRHACFTLANELQCFLDCTRVAISIRPRPRALCRVIAISGVAQFDRRSAVVRAIESAADEALLRDETTAWPPTDSSRRHSDLAHKSLCSLSGETSVMSAPLRIGGKPLGAITVITNRFEEVPNLEKFFATAEACLAGSLGIVQRCEGSKLSRTQRAAVRFFRTWRGVLVLACCAAACCAMFVPISYDVKCDCQLEPVTRRVISAPFDATLDKTLVKPGDLVEKGDLLARLDGRRIRWERAGVLADHKQAAKKRDAAQAAHRYSDAQIAVLEMQRLDQKLRLLDHQSQHLRIKSPVHGIVTGGDLERVEGASLVIGQTLLEVAPLQKMLVEVAVADEDIAYVRQKQPIEIRLDAYPHEIWSSRVKIIQPRSEIREQENVFIVEGSLENAQGRLRPGMKGRAKIETPPQPLGWILFHKPIEHLKKILHW